MLAPCESSKRQLCRVVGPVLQFLILKAPTFKARNFPPLPIATHFILNFQSGKQLFSTGPVNLHLRTGCEVTDMVLIKRPSTFF